MLVPSKKWNNLKFLYWIALKYITNDIAPKAVAPVQVHNIMLSLPLCLLHHFLFAYSIQIERFASHFRANTHTTYVTQLATRCRSRPIRCVVCIRSVHSHTNSTATSFRCRDRLSMPFSWLWIVDQTKRIAVARHTINTFIVKQTYGIVILQNKVSVVCDKESEKELQIHEALKNTCEKNHWEI